MSLSLTLQDNVSRLHGTGEEESGSIFTGMLWKGTCTSSAWKRSRWRLLDWATDGIKWDRSAFRTKPGGLWLPAAKGWLCLPLQMNTCRKGLVPWWQARGWEFPLGKYHKCQVWTSCPSGEEMSRVHGGTLLLQGTGALSADFSYCPERLAGDSELGYLWGRHGPWISSPASLPCGHLQYCWGYLDQQQLSHSPHLQKRTVWGTTVLSSISGEIIE